MVVRLHESCIFAVVVVIVVVYPPLWCKLPLNVLVHWNWEIFSFVRSKNLWQLGYVKAAWYWLLVQMLLLYIFTIKPLIWRNHFEGLSKTLIEKWLFLLFLKLWKLAFYLMKVINFLLIIISFTTCQISWVYAMRLVLKQAAKKSEKR